MKAIYLLGVDVGTSSIKTVILDSNAKVVAEETDFYRLINPDQVSIQVDAADMWRAFINCVSHLISRNNVDPALIGAISISSLCPGLAAFDATGKLLVDPIIYSDRRSTQEAEIFREKVGDKRLFEITANSAMAGAMSGTSMLWIKRNLPEIYERTKYFGHINTLMAQKLCGNFAIDHSNASYTLLYETVDRGIWSEELCEKVGIDIEKLPPLHKSTDVVGQLTNQELLDFVARRLYEMAAVCVMSHLLLQDATKAPELFAQSLNVYVNYAEAEVEKHFNFIRKFQAEELASYRK